MFAHRPATPLRRCAHIHCTHAPVFARLHPTSIAAGVNFPASLVPALKAKIAALANPAPLTAAGLGGAPALAMASSLTPVVAAPPAPPPAAPAAIFRVEAVTPVDPKAVKVASTPKPTITSFFGKVPAPGASVSAASASASAQLPSPRAAPTAEVEFLGESGAGARAAGAGAWPAKRPLALTPAAAHSGAVGRGAGSGAKKAKESAGPGLTAYFSKAPLKPVTDLA